MSAVTLGQNIIAALRTLEPLTGSPNRVTGTSNVASDNPYRPVLESIRGDLYHFDEEKRERIIFTIQEVLHETPPESRELLAVFERVLEVVQTYRDQGVISASPAKKFDGPKASSNGKPGCARSLFQDLDNALKS